MVNAWDDLDEDERPPKHLWTDGLALKAWFAEIRARRKRDPGGGSAQPMEQNAAARDLIRGR